ncbi:Mur ligase family protein [Synechococcus sp. KORDI-52]|uniref:Mur ligase family protein n=1 Tax=Synechococcus sp. KORDI-52 TaxID=585425 RepID=UPI0009FC6310|nr:Mur ligase family protein [Synechococcus sp. KORDI-52]
MSITINDIQQFAGKNFYPPLPGDLVVNLNHNLKRAGFDDVVFLPFNKPENHKIYDFLKGKHRLNVKALIADREHPVVDALTTPKLCVDDAYDLYRRLAKLARSRFEGEMVMIIGSAGKTALKIYLSQLMSDAKPCHAAVDSKNRTRSICRTLTSIPKGTDVCLVEAATADPSSVIKRSEIIQPTIILASEFLEEHMKYHPNMNTLVATKLKSLNSLQGDKILIHQYQEHLDSCIQKAVQAACIDRVFTYGWSDRCDACINAISLSPEGQTVSANVLGVDLQFQIPFMEKHAALQVTAAMLLCKLFGLDLNQLKNKTSRLTNYESSGNMHLLQNKSGIKQIHLYSCCDRGSFPSFSALIETLKSTKDLHDGRRVAIFSKMRDFHYNKSYQFNDQNLIDSLNQSGIDLLITLWDFSLVHDVSRLSIPVIHYDTLLDLKSDLLGIIQNNDMVYLKGTWTVNESLKTIRDLLFSEFEFKRKLY